MENKVLGPAIRQVIEQGREEGRQQPATQILRRLLQRRFGALPAWAETKRTTASRETLESWIGRCLVVDSLHSIRTESPQTPSKNHSQKFSTPISPIYNNIPKTNPPIPQPPVLP